MFKFDRLPHNTIELLPRAEFYLKGHPKVVFAYLFGSLVKGRPTSLSDIDIAVHLSADSEILEDRLEILGKLIELLETDEIDLVILNAAPLPLKARIIGNKRIMVDKAPFLRHKFESLTLREYFDFKVLETDILNRRYSIGR